MTKLNLKSVLASSVLGLIAAATTAVPLLFTPRSTVAQPAPFACGPGLRTYIVRPLDNRSGVGIRCVKFAEGQPGTPQIPRLAWYGEGNWNGGTYRHVGHAFYQGAALVGFASDTFGNGETFNGNYPGNLRLQVAPGGTRIRVVGAWREDWILVNSVNYAPMPKPETCGQYFDEYRVADLAGSRTGEGLRCMLRIGRPNTTWFGNGVWGAATYSHLGTRSFNGFGANDVCHAGFGSVCGQFGWGSLNLAPAAPHGFDVTGAWSETWR